MNKKWVKSKFAKLIGYYFLYKLREFDEKELIIKFNSGELNYKNIIIEESSKGIYILNNKKTLKSEFFWIKKSLNKKIRNINLLFLSLLKFEGIKRYIQYQNLNKEDIKKISYFIKYKKYKKGQYIFRYGDYSDKLYGIIKGKVELKTIKCYDYTQKILIDLFNEEDNLYNFKNNNIIDIPIEKLMSDLEEESNKEKVKIKKKNRYRNHTTKEKDHILVKQLKNVNLTIKYHKLIKDENIENFISEFENYETELKEGICFGEYSVINNLPRSNSILCKSDVDIFYLEKKYVDKFLSYKFNKSNYDKMEFVRKLIPSIKMNYQIFSQFIPIFPKKNYIIYTPYDKIKYIYIIFKGECSFGYLNIHNNNKEEYLSLFREIQKICFLNKGAICGSEITKGKIFYNYSLIVEKENTILFKIDINLFQSICPMKILELLYDKRINIIKSLNRNKSMCLTAKNINISNFDFKKDIKEKIKNNDRKLKIKKIRISLSNIEPKNNKRLSHSDIDINYNNKNKNKKINFKSSFSNYHNNIKINQKPNLFRIVSQKKKKKFTSFSNNSSIRITNDKSYSDYQKSLHQKNKSENIYNTQRLNSNVLNKIKYSDKELFYNKIKKKKKEYEIIKDKVLKKNSCKSGINYYNSGSFNMPLISNN